MEKVKAKKHLGQHFLKDKKITEKIAGILEGIEADELIEIGPGMGILTEFLFAQWGSKLHCIEIDGESVRYLKNAPWAKDLRVTEGDFLAMDERELFSKQKMGVIGNYPYNISTQIAFRVLENKDKVVFFGGMFQREVARRFCAEHGNKEYGITSVLLQAFYDCKYIFTVDENAFSPPPAVKSGVMACTRKEVPPDCHYADLHRVVKTAFSQRRKTLSNALKPLTSSRTAFQLPEEWKQKRAEQLAVADFVVLAKAWEVSR